MRTKIRHTIVLILIAIVVYLTFAFVEAEWINLFEQDKWYRLNYLGSIFSSWLWYTIIYGIYQSN